jgi:hypothetical protein
MTGFPKPTSGHRNSFPKAFLKAAQFGNSAGFFDAVCCGFWRPIHNNTYSFQNSFKPVGVELEKHQRLPVVRQISERCHRSAKKMFNYFSGKLGKVNI